MVNPISLNKYIYLKIKILLINLVIGQFNNKNDKVMIKMLIVNFLYYQLVRRRQKMGVSRKYS